MDMHAHVLIFPKSKLNNKQKSKVDNSQTKGNRKCRLLKEV